MIENKNGPTATQPQFPRWLAIAMVAFLPIVGTIIIAAGIYFLIVAIINCAPFLAFFLICLLFIGTGIFLILLGWNYFSGITARYQYTTEGLVVKYPFQPEILLSWTSFQQVCVCYAAYTTRGERCANAVICFVKHGEKKNGYLRWKTDNPFRHRSVICVDYSPELYAQIQSLCPYDIPDLRQTPPYKMYY